MRRLDIRIALLLRIVLLIASPVALATAVPRDGVTTVTMDAGHDCEDARGTMSAKGDLNHDGEVTQADALIALQMAARGEYSEDADVRGEFQVANPGINGNFTVAAIAFEELGVGRIPIDLEIATLADSTSQVNHLAHSIRNGTVTICQT